MALLTEVNGCYSVAFCVATYQSIRVLKQGGESTTKTRLFRYFKVVSDILGRKCCIKLSN